MNLANVLTLSRFVMIPLFFAAFFQGKMILALGIVLLAGVTDLLDGYIARSSGQVTATGVMLDPLADKLMMLSVVIALVIANKIPWEAAAAMAVREGGMIASSAIFHFRGKPTLPANALGKLTTFLFYVAIVLLFFDLQGGVPALWFAIVMSFAASFVYLAQFRARNGNGGVPAAAGVAGTGGAGSHAAGAGVADAHAAGTGNAGARAAGTGSDAGGAAGTDGVAETGGSGMAGPGGAAADGVSGPEGVGGTEDAGTKGWSENGREKQRAN